MTKNIFIAVIAMLFLFGCKSSKNECDNCPVSVLENKEIMLFMDDGLASHPSDYLMFCNQKKNLLFDYNGIKGTVTDFPEEMKHLDIPVMYPVIISGEIYKNDDDMYNMHISEITKICEPCNQYLYTGKIDHQFFLCKDSVPNLPGTNTPTLVNAIVVPSDPTEFLTFDIEWNAKGIVCSYPSNIRDMLEDEPVPVLVKGNSYFNDILPTSEVPYPIDIEITHIEKKTPDECPSLEDGKTGITKEGVVRFKLSSNGCNLFMIFIDGSYYHPVYLCDRFMRNGLNVHITYNKTGDNVSCTPFGEKVPNIEILDIKVKE